METDYYFRMGRTHSICQDYAIAGLSEGRPYALLSDGCSGCPVKGDPGSPHTDLGARLLVRSASHHLEDLFDGEFPHDKILSESLGMVRQIAVPSMALDATLLVAVLGERYFRTFQTGDGVVVCRMRDGSVRYFQTRFGANMPYYLNYRFNRHRHQAYIEEAKTVTLTSNRFEPGVGWGTATERVEDLNEFRICQTHIFDKGDVEVVLILSDGIESFMRKGTTESIPLEAVIEQVCAFKNFGGDFLTRRLNAFLERYCVQAGWVHNDDFSCAAIYAGPVAP